MNYSIYFPNNCGCQSNPGVYGSNVWNPNWSNPGNSPTCGHPQACNGCLDLIKGECIRYTGANLVNTGINKNDDLNVVLAKIDALFLLQNTKNTNILAALNDLNTRVNALETDAGIPGGGSHPPYTLI